MQQLSTQTNKEELKDFRRALRTGNTISITSRYSEEEIVRLIKSHYQWDSNAPRVWFFILFIGSILLLNIGRSLKIWPLIVLAILLFMLAMSFAVFTYASKSESWKALGQKLRTASLPTLLDAYSLGIPDLTDSLQECIAGKLPATPDDVLEELTLPQRKQLIAFTLAQMQLLWSKPRGVCDKHAQAATLGYLALGTLKQSGAERPNRRGIEPHNTNLSQAIDEYLAALETPNR